MKHPYPKVAFKPAFGKYQNETEAEAAERNIREQKRYFNDRQLFGSVWKVKVSEHGTIWLAGPKIPRKPSPAYKAFIEWMNSKAEVVCEHDGCHWINLGIAADFSKIPLFPESET